MVLWEMTLATAYFLGLKRTYRLALKIQRRLISSKHHKIRQFAHRRTRAIFDVAIKVHKNIQERDLEVGRSLGNWILRWLDRFKPSANIRGAPKEKLPGHNNFNTSTPKQTTNYHQKSQGGIQRFSTRSFEQGSDKHLFSTARNGWPRSFPSIAMMMRHTKPVGVGNTTQYRQLCINGRQLLTPAYVSGGFEGVIRKDILLWMQRK